MRMFSSQARHAALEYDLMKERAGALGRCGAAVQDSLRVLREAAAPDAALQEKLLYAAAGCVHRYFIQREACGLREHTGVIAEYRIPQAVLARVGAKAPDHA
jgi:hypothetical protein